MNIPVREIASKEPLISGRVIDYYWFRYVIPPVEVERRTLIAVNVGGAVIPVLLSGYLFTKVDFPDLLLAVFLMTVFMHTHNLSRAGSHYRLYFRHSRQPHRS
ncbi:MAG: DUF1614 domain-containing protein [Candidatus Methanoperedens sp.]|nr:DUF1614 domain-containing protein [Candidatus Methanoperedens sp.]